MRSSPHFLLHFYWLFSRSGLYSCHIVRRSTQDVVEFLTRAEFNTVGRLLVARLWRPASLNRTRDVGTMVVFGLWPKAPLGLRGLEWRHDGLIKLAWSIVPQTVSKFTKWSREHTAVNWWAGVSVSSLLEQNCPASAAGLLHSQPWECLIQLCCRLPSLTGHCKSQQGQKAELLDNIPLI